MKNSFTWGLYFFSKLNLNAENTNYLERRASVETESQHHMKRGKTNKCLNLNPTEVNRDQ